MIESVQARIARMEAEKAPRQARAQQYEEAMHTDSPTLPIMTPIREWVKACNDPIIGKTAPEVNEKHRVESKQKVNRQLYMREYMRQRREARKAGAR